MKKIYKLLSIIVCGTMITSEANAQAITESFASVATLTTTGGWAQQNLSTPVGTNPNWFQGSGSPAAFSGPTTECVMVNYNSVAGAATISNWLFTPNRTFSNGDVIKFYTKTAGGYADRLQVRLSLNGASVNAGTTNTSVGDFTTLLLDINPTLVVANYPTAWTQYSVTISGLGAPTSGRAAFRYFVTNGGPSGANSNLIAIDDFQYIPFGAPTAPDVTVGKYGEYTEIPLLQVSPMTLGTTVNNIGTASTSDAMLTVNVYQAPNFVTPIQTTTSTTATIAAGGSVTLNAGSYTPSALGNYVYEFISSCTGNTVTTADTSYYGFSVVANEYARDNGTPVQSVGGGNTLRVIIGSTFKINTTTYLDSVLFFVNPGVAGLGDTIRVKIGSTTAGVPSNTGYIGQSAIHKFTAAQTTTAGAVMTLPVRDLSSNRLSLTPGVYFVGIEESTTGDSYGLFCTQDIFVANTVFANINDGTYSPLNTLISGFNYVPIIRPYLNTCAGTSITVNSGAICSGSSFTMTPNGATSYTYSSGSAVVSPTANASYTVTGENNACINTAVSNVTVNAAPSVSVNSGTICSGNSFTMTPSGATSYTYSSGSAVVSPTANASYTVTGEDNGCTNTAISSVSVSAPVISVNSGAICAGQSFTMMPTGADTYTYSNGSAVATPTTAMASYTVSGTDINGCVAVDAVASITVNALPTVSVNNGTICSGSSFTMMPTGATTYTYSNGTDVVMPTSDASYTVTGTDANGCVNTAVSTVSVNAAPSVMAATNNTLLCTGFSATLTASGASTYTWSTAENTADIVVSPTVQTTYTVMGTDANGCMGTTTITQDIDLCTGVAQLTGIANEFSVSPNPSNGVFNIHVSTGYNITILDVLGKVVYSEQLQSGTYTINLNQYANGLYILKAESNGGSKTIRLVKH